MNQKKLEDIDNLIDFVNKDLCNEVIINSNINKLKLIIDHLKDLKGFLNFIDNYGEIKLDIMNIANLSLDEMPKDKHDYCKAVWYAFNVGRKCEKEGMKI